MSFNPNSPGEGLTQFFDKIWGDVEGLVYIARKSGPADAATWQRGFFKWPEKKKFVVDTVLLADTQGKEVYFSPALWSDPKISKESFKGTRVLWADFDGSAPEWGAPSTDSSADGPVGAVPGPPTVEVQSSTEDHRHVYWMLEEFTTDVQFVENTNRAIAYAYGADTSGWDAEQILRPPFTTNHKRNQPVLIARFDESTYPATGFNGFKPVKEYIVDEIKTSELPDPVATIAKYTWESDTADLLNRESVDEGSRSSAMMRIAYYCAERGMSDVESYSILFWLDEKWGKFKHRTDRQKRLADLVNKARQKYPHGVDSVGFSGLLGENQPEPTVNEQLHWRWADFLSADIRVSWVFEGLLQEEGIGILVSPGGVGKSQFSIQLGAAASLQKEFLGHPATGQYRTGFLSCEMGPVRLKSLMSTIGQGYTPEETATLQENFVLSPLGQGIPLKVEAGRNWLRKYLDDYSIEFLVVDSLGKVVEDLNDDAEVRKVYGFLQSLRVPVWVIHHTRKAQEGNKKPNKLGDVYGSQYITSEPDYVGSLWKEEGYLEWSHLKNRMAEENAPMNIARTPYLSFEKLVKDVAFNGLLGSTEERSNSAKPEFGGGDLFK